MAPPAITGLKIVHFRHKPPKAFDLKSNRSLIVRVMKHANLTTRYFRVATSGTTVDGREISAQDIEDIANSYDPDEYTALINYEHYRFFGNFGKVTSLKSERDKKKRRVLYAQITPNKRLLELNDSKQKLFTSIEITKNFAGTGRPYLLGLALTDSPASLGVEALCFAAQNNGPADERFKNNYFSKTEEMEPFTMANNDQTPDTPQDIHMDGADKHENKQTFMQKFSNLLKPVKEESDENFTALQDASLELAQKYSEQSETITDLAQDVKSLTDSFAAQKAEIEKLTAALEQIPEGGTNRPVAAGEEDQHLAEC